MRVGITGAFGFLGWHLRCRLRMAGIDQVQLAGRSTVADSRSLDAFVAASDVVVHLAGVNRADTEQEVYGGNVEAARALAGAIERNSEPCAIVYANSTKADYPGAYGESKALAGQILGDAARASGSTFDSVVLPHLFGEYGVPHYNSAVHTFAHQIVNDEAPKVLSDGQLELLHAQDASRLLLELCIQPADTEHRPPGRRQSVVETLDQLKRLAAPYLTDGSVPALTDTFDLRMFNLVRSYCLASRTPISIRLHADQRGTFYEVMRAGGMGQTSISTTVPGVTRGDHYHEFKIERFVVVSGEATIRLRRLLHTEILEFVVDAETPVAIDMPPLTTHNITNTGDQELVTLFWSNDHFDPASPDTFPEVV